MRRRTFLRTVGGLSLAGFAGCSDGSGSGATATPGENEVMVAPDGSLSFAPETLTVTPGTTVTWRFASPTHNVSCDPDHNDAASLPDDAEPFASYEGGNMNQTEDAGTTFEHTFEVTGNYDYVCIPHAASRMVGTIRVQE